MKSADEYAEESRNYLIGSYSAQHEQRYQDAMVLAMWAQADATLAQAAATLEAARLTLDAQASNLLSALEESELGQLDYVPCLHKWYGCAMGESGDHVCDLVTEHTQVRHHCGCGAISR
jgi:hypothetical protein